jgi:23S rRNA pseudoU1915 N3-methylase RlmH
VKVEKLFMLDLLFKKQSDKARQNTGRFRAVETVLQVFKQASTNNMESQQEKYTIPKSHALVALLQLGQQLESACIHVHVNKLRNASFGYGSMMIGSLKGQSGSQLCMKSKHHREKGLSSATHQHISARVFILTACCGILTSVFYQLCGYCWGKSVLQESMNIQCSMHEAANEILYSLGGISTSCGCIKHNKMEDQHKCEYMHT